METENISRLPWLEEVKRKAKKDFDSLPLPEEREEAWRYTNLKQLKMNFRSSDSSAAMIDCDNDRIITMDFATAMLKHADLVGKYFSKLIKGTDKISAFHFANFSDGIFVYVPKHERAAVSATFESPNAHSIIILGEGASLSYAEELCGDTDCTPTDATEIFLGENASLDFSSLQNYGAGTNAFSIKSAELQRNANIRWTFFSAGANFYRLAASAYFNGEGSSSETATAFLGRGGQHADITTNAFHNVPHTQNNILAKGVLLDSSTGVYRGLIKIGKNANQTNSYLSDHMLMVGDNALAHSIPSLQIDTNDVKASHGSTKGQVDEEQLFYLMSRGISREEAEQLIVQGFLMPVMMRITNAELRGKIAQIIGVGDE